MMNEKRERTIPSSVQSKLASVTNSLTAVHGKGKYRSVTRSVNLNYPPAYHRESVQARKKKDQENASRNR